MVDAIDKKQYEYRRKNP